MWSTKQEKVEDERGLGLHREGIKIKSFLYYLKIVFEVPSRGKEIYIRKVEMSTT
jgi:hypothetical protein